MLLKCPFFILPFLFCTGCGLQLFTYAYFQQTVSLIQKSTFYYAYDKKSYSLFVFHFLEEEETTVLVVATIVWGLRKCSHAVILILIFLIAIRPGLMHAVYSKFNE